MRVAIIGAGIVGSSIARVLSRYRNLVVYLLEREVDVGWGASKANTGLIHPGYGEDPDEHPLRARLCAAGNRIWRRWARELDVRLRWPGELALAFVRKDLDAIRRFITLGYRNRVPGLRLLDRDELESFEPNVSGEALGALWAPSCGQILPWEAVTALIENASANGVKLNLETEVRDIKIEGWRVKGVETNRGFLSADIVINASGINADTVSRMAGIDHFSIHPRKGEYILFRGDSSPKVVRVLHRVPVHDTKGVYVTTTIEGNLMIGPNVQDLPGELKGDKATSIEGLDSIWMEAEKLVKRLPPRDEVLRVFAGLRAEPSWGDFIIEAYDEAWGFINVAGIRSPGLTSAPAIAYYVRDLIGDRLGIRLEMKDKGEWTPYRRGILRAADASWRRLGRLIDGNPGYGKIICKCRMVSEAEVVEAVRRGARTLDGVKYRTGAMTGDCQGSFCRIRIGMILARELGIPLWEVTLQGGGTEYGLGDVKVLQGRSGQP